MGPLRALVNGGRHRLGQPAPSARTVSYDSAHDLDTFKKVIEVNLVGTFNCIRSPPPR